MPNERTLAWLGQKHNLYSMTGCQLFWGCFYLLRISYWSGWLSEYLKSARAPKNNISYICPNTLLCSNGSFPFIYHKREIHYEVFLTHNLSSTKSEINSRRIMEKFREREKKHFSSGRILMFSAIQNNFISEMQMCTNNVTVSFTRLICIHIREIILRFP